MQFLISLCLLLTIISDMSFLEKVIGHPVQDIMSMDVTITFYSLRPQETDDTPDQAAYGKSMPFMAAITPKVTRALGLSPGDRVFVISDDKKISTIVTYWDRMNRRYDDENRIDIVAPSLKVAKRWGIRKGRVFSCI